MKHLIQKTGKKTLLITLALLVVLTLVGFSAFAFNWVGNKETTAPIEPKVESNTPSIDAPSTENQVDSGAGIKKESLKQSETTDSPTTSLGVTIDAYNRDTTQIKVVVNISSIVSAGECVLNVTSPGVSKTYSAGIQALAQYSTCKGFDLNRAEFNNDILDLTVTVTSGQASGTATKTIR